MSSANRNPTTTTTTTTTNAPISISGNIDIDVMDALEIVMSQFEVDFGNRLRGLDFVDETRDTSAIQENVDAASRQARLVFEPLFGALAGKLREQANRKEALTSQVTALEACNASTATSCGADCSSPLQKPRVLVAPAAPVAPAVAPTEAAGMGAKETKAQAIPSASATTTSATAAKVKVEQLTATSNESPQTVVRTLLSSFILTLLCISTGRSQTSVSHIATNVGRARQIFGGSRSGA
jgi:hypothetical protein